MENNYKFVFDVETSGLPLRSKSINKKDKYKILKDYDTARILSLSYIILDNDNKEVEKKTYFIKPDNFEISEESKKIHKITEEYLQIHGVNHISFYNYINRIFHNYKFSRIISHNINFDINILKSELYRYKYASAIKIIENIELFCTMLQSYDIMSYHKWPKLSEAYQYFYNETTENAHSSEYDTLYCSKIYIKLESIIKKRKQKNEIKNKNKRIKI